jgi:hypothetical protein
MFLNNLLTSILATFRPNYHLFHQDKPKSGGEVMNPENHEEIVEFLMRNQSQGELQKVLTSSDMDIVRVLEDLIDLLCKNHVIIFTDLPDVAQKKLADRKSIRVGLDSIGNLISKEDDGIF